MTMITPSYLGETIEYSSLHACRSTLEDPTEGAAERNKSIAPDIAAPLIAAVVKTTGIVKMKTIEPMIANKHAFEIALKELHIMPLNPVAV